MTAAIAVALMLAAAPAPLEKGQVAPDFEAKTTDGKPFKLSEAVRSKTVVLAFFPKAFTPGCTRQMTAFTEQYKVLEEKGALVIGISMDDNETLARFKKDLKAPFPFIADPEGRISTLFGVRSPGAKYADRKNFVIGRDRKLLEIESGMFAIDPDEAIAACPGPAAAPKDGK